MTFFLTLLFMLLVLWRPQEWLLPWMYGWPILDAVFGLSVLTFLIEVDQRTVRLPRRSPHLYLIGGLLAGALLSHIAHTYFAGMMQALEEVSKLCIFSTLLFCVLDRPSRLRKVAALFVGMAATMAIHALLQQRRGYGFGGLPPLFVPPRIDRPMQLRSLFFGIFGDPNDLAQILATSMPFCFALFRRRGVFPFIVGTTLAALLVSGVLATHSRGGLLALLAAMAVIAAMMFPPRMMPYLLGGMVVMAMIAMPFSGGHLDDSAHDRVAFWGEANRIFKQNPIFGVGYRMFSDYIRGDRAAHNAFVLCYTELGLVGYWFWFTLVQLCAMGAWRSREALRRVRGVESAWLGRFGGLALASLVGFMASSYFLSRAYVFPLFFLYAVLGAVPVLAMRLLPAGSRPILNGRRDILLYGTLGSVGSIIYIYFSILVLNRVYYG